MAGDDAANPKNERSNNNPYKDPLFIVVNDNASSSLGSIVFDGNNFISWIKSI